MSKKPDPEILMSIDLNQLDAVSGGKHHGSSGDPVLSQLSSLASGIKDLTAKTSGFSSSQMLLLGLLFMQRNQAPQTNVVYVSRGRWW
jgi:hypothetical protein